MLALESKKETNPCKPTLASSRVVIDREFKQNAAALLEDDAGSIRAIWSSPAGFLAGGDGSFSKKVSCHW
jgi:hypothetical protein